MRQVSAGAAFGRAEAAALSAQEAADMGGEAVRLWAAGYYILVSVGLQAAFQASGLGLQRGQGRSFGGQPQFDITRRGKVGQPHLFRQLVLESFQFLGQGRFGHIVDDEHPVVHRDLGKTPVQARHHFFVHQAFHLERHARQRNGLLAVLAEPHSCGCPFAVGQYFGLARQKRLVSVELVHRGLAVGQ